MSRSLSPQVAQWKGDKAALQERKRAAALQERKRAAQDWEEQDTPSLLADVAFQVVDPGHELDVDELAHQVTLRESIYAYLMPDCGAGPRLYMALVFVTEVEDAMDVPDELEKNMRVMYDVVEGSGPDPVPLSPPEAHVMLGAALPPLLLPPTSHLPL